MPSLARLIFVCNNVNDKAGTADVFSLRVVSWGVHFFSQLHPSFHLSSSAWLLLSPCCCLVPSTGTSCRFKSRPPPSDHPTFPSEDQCFASISGFPVLFPDVTQFHPQTSSCFLFRSCQTFASLLQFLQTNLNIHVCVCVCRIFKRYEYNMCTYSSLHRSSFPYAGNWLHSWILLSVSITSLVT